MKTLKISDCYIQHSHNSDSDAFPPFTLQKENCLQIVEKGNAKQTKAFLYLREMFLKHREKSYRFSLVNGPTAFLYPDLTTN